LDNGGVTKVDAGDITLGRYCD